MRVRLNAIATCIATNRTRQPFAQQKTRHNVVPRSCVSTSRVSNERLRARGSSRINRLLQPRLGLYAYKPIHDFAVLENHECWNAAHAVILGGVGGIIHVQLSDLDLALVFAS